MFNTKQPLCCDKSSPFISKSSCVFHKTLHFKNPHVFSQNTSFYINHLNPSNYKTCLYNLFVYLYTKNTKDCPVFFSQKHYISKKSSCVLTKHLNPSNYKPCLYNLFVYLYTKIPKTLLCFFTKTLHFKKILMCFFTKHLNPSNYKTCLYNLFVYLYTKNTKDPPVFFSQKHYISKKSSCVFSQNTFHKNTTFHQKHLNPSNYKTCLYNLFVYLYTKIPKTLLCFFHKNTTFQKNPHVFFHKTLFSQKHYISYQKHLNPSNYKTCLYNLFVYLYTKIPKTLLCFFHKNTTFQKNPHVFFHKTLFSQKHYISYQKHLNPSNYKTCLYNLFVYLYTKIPKTLLCFFHKNTTFQKNPHVFFHKTLKSE